MKGDIKSIMIVTKARDNHLIKLTRELSLYLMNRDNPGKERGLIVYVYFSLISSLRLVTSLALQLLSSRSGELDY